MLSEVSEQLEALAAQLGEEMKKVFGRKVKVGAKPKVKALSTADKLARKKFMKKQDDTARAKGFKSAMDQHKARYAKPKPSMSSVRAKMMSKRD